MSSRDPIIGERAVLSGAKHNRLGFHCPGCQLDHVARVGEGTHGPAWEWNGDLDRPTLSPSLLVTYNGPDAGEVDADGHRAPSAVCHSFVVNGQIQFLTDCTHSLAGVTVALPRWKGEAA